MDPPKGNELRIKRVVSTNKHDATVFAASLEDAFAGAFIPHLNGEFFARKHRRREATFH